jgi:hypothetical protein
MFEHVSREVRMNIELCTACFSNAHRANKQMGGLCFKLRLQIHPPSTPARVSSTKLLYHHLNIKISGSISLDCI